MAVGRALTSEVMSMSNILIVAAMAVALSSTPIFAQDAGLELPRHKRAIGVVVGLTQFDLSGTGNTLLVGARAETELQPWLIGEAALGVFRPEEQFLARATYFGAAVVAVTMNCGSTDSSISSPVQ